MNEQIINDFWKEKMIFFQRNNQRFGSPVENLDQAYKEILSIENKFPQIKSEIEKSEGYISWVLTLSPDFQIRLFIQRMTKISFMGKAGSGFEKIADSKLFNSPFIQLVHFLSHFDQYTVELHQVSEKGLKNEKKLKIASQFLKSRLISRFKNSSTEYFVESQKDRLKITIKNGADEKLFLISPEEVPDFNF